jgi:hypothetical protein
VFLDIIRLHQVLLSIEKRKAVLLPDRRDPLGSKTSRLPYFVDSRLTDDGEVVSLTLLLPFTLWKFRGTRFC